MTTPPLTQSRESRWRQPARRTKANLATGKASPDIQPLSRTGENPPYGILGEAMETSASFEARSAPLPYPTTGRKQRMKDPHEEGVANHSAPSLALCTARCAGKHKQGNRWAGYRAPKICNQGADVFNMAEGNTNLGDSASRGLALRSLRPQTRLDTFCTRTGRPPRRPDGRDRRAKAEAGRPACTWGRSRTGA